MRYIAKIIAVILLICASSNHAAEPQERGDIDEKYKWDLTDMYVSTDSWRADILKYNALLPEIESNRGRLGNDGKTLLAAIQKMEEIEMLISDIFVYAGLKSYEDMRVGENSANFSQARTLSTKYSEATSYMRPELLAIPPQKLAGMISSTEGLEIYRHFIDEQLRMRDYTLSEAEERILASASDALGKFSGVYGAFNNADIMYGNIVDAEGNTVELTKARFAAFMSSTDRRVREDAWKGVYGAYERLGNTLAANYEGHVKARVFKANIRGFDSALQAATYRNAIPTEVYTNLIEAARQGSGPLQRYMEIRRVALGLETLQPWDTSAPIGEETIKDISFEEAKQIVADALTPLGDEYVNAYWKGFSEGWVDVYESQGKRGGAYSWGTYRSKPYLSMNYNGTFSSVSTLAHEYGHSIHRSLASQAQPYTYASSRTFISEIASMTNEAILFQKMLSEADSKEDKVFLLQTYLDEFRGGFYTQALFADYEMQAHAAVESGKALNKDALNKIYHDTYIAYYGDTVQMDPLVDSTWSRIPHFLRNDNFYVYQYATSFVAATALAEMILKEGEPARLRFLNLLRSGSKDYPIELLKKTGIDMTTATPVIATIEVFDQMVNELERVLKE
ncbi:oligoendopeptidase F [Gammaproteobacteria bacterium]|nr:oligoendopeptidase F [Gammaproteobacteria bacterium]